MASEVTRFKVGLFLVGGLLLGSAALVWLGATRILEKQALYVTYFSESVQGLAVGSAVKYQGVPLGRVTAIRVAPDGRLVEVEMGIDPGFRVRPGMRARLAAVGITGAAFVDIGYPEEEAPPPELPFPPPERYIPSAPSFMNTLGQGLAGLVADLHRADLPAVAAEVRALAAEIRAAVRASDAAGTLDRLGRAADALARAADRIGQRAADPRWDDLLERSTRTARALEAAAGAARDAFADPALREGIRELAGLASDLRDATAELRRALQGLRLAERLDRMEAGVRQASRGVGAAAERVSARVERSLDRIDRSALGALDRVAAAAARLERLAEELEEAPSRVLWEEPPEEEVP